MQVRAAVADAFGTQALEAIDKRGSGKAYRLIPNPGWDFVGERVQAAMKNG